MTRPGIEPTTSRSRGGRLSHKATVEVVCWAVHVSLLYCIDRRVYLNLFQIDSKRRMGMKALKPAANGRYLMCKSLPCYFHLLYRSTFIFLSAKCMLGLFVLRFRNPPSSDMDYRIFNVRTFLCVRVHTGVEHTDGESAQQFDSEKLSQIFLVLRTGIEPLVMESIGSRGRRSTN